MSFLREPFRYGGDLDKTRGLNWKVWSAWIAHGWRISWTEPLIPILAAAIRYRRGRAGCS